MKRMINPRAMSGFSLVEMLVVLAIIAMILGLMAPRVLQQLGGAESKAAKATVSRLQSGVENYYLDTGKYPQSLEDLVDEPGDVAGWLGPYIKRSNLQDPWGHDFHYDFPGEHGEFDIYTLGFDNRQGGDGKSSDHGNWE